MQSDDQYTRAEYEECMASAVEHGYMTYANGMYTLTAKGRGHVEKRRLRNYEPSGPAN